MPDPGPGRPVAGRRALRAMNPTRRLLLPFRTVACTAAALLVASAGAVRAGQTDTTFAVSGTFVASCEVSASALGFGTTVPSPIVSPIDATSTVTATCSTALPFTVALDAGTGSAGDPLDRRMTGSAGTLRYAMYVDASRTQVWGDGSAGTSVATLSGTGAAQPIPVYGRILAGQTPPPGAYADQVVVTVRF
ncbi:MAG: hypothetical protein RJA99_3538 [Pseudomonadota bacterium]